VGRLQPLVQGDVAPFEDGHDLEMLLGVTTALQGGARPNRRDPVNSTAMRANRPFRPYDVLIGINGAEVLGSSSTIIGGSANQYLAVSSSPASPDGLGSFYNTIIAGNGNDTLSATENFYATLKAGSGNDTLLSGLSGSLGASDVLIAGAGADTLITAQNGDTLIAGSGATEILRSTGSGSFNTLMGGSGHDTLSSSASNDTLVASGANNTLISTGVNNTLVGSGGGSTLVGGAGAAVAWYNGNSNIVVNLTTGTGGTRGSGTSDTLIGITAAEASGTGDTLIGGTGITTLIGNASGNTLEAGTGQTMVLTNNWNASVNLSTGILGGSGLTTHDVLIGLTGAETWGSNDTIVGGAGSEYLEVADGPSASDGSSLNTIIAGSGTDTLYANGVNASTLIAGTGTAADTLLAGGGGGENVLKGNNGADLLSTTETGDTLMAGGGTQLLTSSNNFNTLVAGTGTDTLINSGSGGAYVYNSGDGSASIVNGSLSNASASNQLQFGTGFTDENLWFQQSGNNLVIDVMGTNNQVTVNNWFAGAGDQLQSFTAGGLKLDGAFSNLVQAMATYSANHPSFNPATTSSAPADAALQSAIAAAWHT
jgi:Ca2+-binding RTX toxin-like protein